MSTSMKGITPTTARTGDRQSSVSSRKRGIDAMLTLQGKTLPIGDSIAFRLVKGPAKSIQADPVDAKAPHETFPLMAKFPESVVKPDFTKHPWRDGRLYQQDIPKPEEDSDDEEANKQQATKKRWKYNRNKPESARQWILQEEVDFLETMVSRRERKASENDGKNKLSSRYEGLPENNSSNYVLLMAPPQSVYDDEHQFDTIQVRCLPTPNATIAFAQPAARVTFSLSQAEQAIHDQRSGIMRRLLPANANGASAPAAAAAATLLRRPVKAATHTNSSKGRLWNKLQQKAAADDGDDVDEADDVMADVAYRNRKGGGGMARKELLTSMGDEGVTVSEDGVLGGSNDTVFGGRQRFSQFQTAKSQKEKSSESTNIEATTNTDAGSAPTDKEDRGADGLAMSDDFYQRDVEAEYEEMDYDANEQFDDDDVDLGESEVVVDGTGFGDDEDEEDDDEADHDDEAVAGAEGLATVAGFKAMLAKARGESPTAAATGESTGALSSNTADDKSAPDDDAKRPASSRAEQQKNEGEMDHMAKIMAAAAKTALAANDKVGKQKAAEKKAAESAIQFDENGLRIISLEAIRREIWLNHGSITTKRLMKIFEIKKKKTSEERQSKFREVVKELCTMKTDPLIGPMLVLKQHYSNMG